MSSLPRLKTRPAATSMISAANAFIDEAQTLHFDGVKEVASVEHNRVSQTLTNTFQVEPFELLPLGSDDDSVAALCDRIHVFGKTDVFQHRSGFVHGLRIIHGQARPFFL